MRSPLVALLALALPMVLARATQAVITFADAFQVSHLGEDAIAATSNGGLNVVGVVLLPMGTVFIVQSFVAQLVGSGQRDQAPRFAWYGLLIAAAAGLIAAALLPVIEPALGFTGYTPAVQERMSSYMTIRFFSVGAIVGVEAIGNWYGGLGNTWMAMVAGILAMIVNVFLNWVLIDGNLGAPALGIDGAALASATASWTAFAFLAVAFWRRWGGAPRGERVTLSRAELLRVVRFGLPNGLNWFLEFAAFQAFINFVLSALGTVTVAAFGIVLAVNSVGFMPAFGLASAGAIIAGQAIGAGNRDAVWPTMKLTLVCTMTWMGVLAVGYLLFPDDILALFASGENRHQLIAVGSTMLVLSAAWQLFDAMALTIAETLRAAGDTFWTAAARLILAWVVFTPAGLLVVFTFDGGAVGAMICLAGYLGLLAAALGYRFRAGAWRSIELIEPKLL